MAFIKIFFISIIIPFVLSIFCKNGNFSQIQANIGNYFELSKNNEICYVYTLSEIKYKISLVFSESNITSTEIIIYKSKTEISKKGKIYENYYDRFLLNENSFKEIDLKDFNESIYIIIRDTEYLKPYINNLILYDTQLPIPLIHGKPLTMKYFLSYNLYKFEFFSNHNLTFLYSTKMKSKKNISIFYNNQTIIENEIDKTDQVFYFKSEDSKVKHLYITIEDIEKDIDTIRKEFSVVIYEKGILEYYEIEKNEIFNLNYINLNKNDEAQTFFFYYNLGKSTKTNIINFMLDKLNNKIEYINIVSGFYHSEKELKQEEFIKCFHYEENKFPIEYDLNSDEYRKLYFQDSDISFPFRYLYFKVEISKLDDYYNPKNMIISIGEEVEDINLSHLEFYKAELIKKEIKPYISTFFKLKLDPNQSYLFISPYPNNTIYIKGDLLIKDENTHFIINKKYFIDKDEIIIIKNISELSVFVFCSDKLNATFYIEKYLDDDLYITENFMSDNPIDIKFEENDCILNRKKYLLGIYDKEIYNKLRIKYTRYWTSIDGEMIVYYKSNISIEGESLFPFSEKYSQQKESLFAISNYINFFTFSCIKPGTVSLRPEYKKFNETILHIGQNTYDIMNISTEVVILQLTSTIKPPSNYLYFAIFSNFGKKVKISPDCPNLFNETIIEGVQPFKLKIDLYKFKPDQLAIRVNSTEDTQIEVIEIIQYNFSEYTLLTDNKINHITDNNFAKFINKKTKKLKVIINGLKNVNINYGIAKLFTDDIKYLPLAFKFQGSIFRKINEQNEIIIEINNTFYGDTFNDKKYLAFVFSIIFYRYHEFDAQVIEEIEDVTDNNGNFNGDNGSNRNVIILIIILVIIIISFVIIIIIFLIIKKNKNEKKFEMDEENTNFQPINEN